MTDLKELIEREIAGFLDWPGDNKNIVTTASAMLFAEHVAKLWAGHIADAGKMAAPDVQGEPGVKWAPEEVANGNKGIRWVSDEGVHGRPTDHDCRVYLESNPNARGCHCPECAKLAEQQPAPDVVGLMEALTELCDEIDNHDIHSAISKTNILWFKRKARAALAPYRKGGDAL